HLAGSQVCRQSSWSSWLPSSHPSPAWTTPSPHVLLMQVGVSSNVAQRYPSEHHPSPHTSPGGGRHAPAPTPAASRKLNNTARLIRFLMSRASCALDVQNRTSAESWARCDDRMGVSSILEGGRASVRCVRGWLSHASDSPPAIAAPPAANAPIAN